MFDTGCGLRGASCVVRVSGCALRVTRYGLRVENQTIPTPAILLFRIPTGA